MTPCSQVEIYKRIVWTPSSGVKMKANKTTGMSACLFNLFFDLKMESKRTFEKLISTGLHSVTSHRITLFISHRCETPKSDKST